MAVFELSEYRERITKTKRLMGERDIDVLLVTNPANMNYLTGYDGWSFYVHQGVLVSVDQADPIWFGRGMDANGARLTTWLEPENIRAYSDDYVQSQVKHPMQFAAGIISEKGWERKTVGVESDQYYFTHRCFAELQRSLPRARLVDADLLVALVRQIKSEREIDFMHRAGRIAEKVMNVAIEEIEVGVRECDVAGKIAQAQYSGIGDHAGDYPAIVPLMMAGERTNSPHLTWSERVYRENEAVILELAGVYRHYHAPIARTLYLGPPPALLQEMSKVVVGGLEKTLQFIKPGVTCEQAEQRWRQAVSGSKIVKESRLAYSFGVNYPPDWGEHTASMRPGDKTILAPNMTFHVIPGIWQEDSGFEVSEAIRITEKGCESFYSFPRHLFVK